MASITTCDELLMHIVFQCNKHLNLSVHNTTCYESEEQGVARKQDLRVHFIGTYLYSGSVHTAVMESPQEC